MNRKTLIGVLAVIILGGVSVSLLLSKPQSSVDVKPSDEGVISPSTPLVSGTEGYKNTSYYFGGSTVTLHDGVSETEAAPGSATKIVTRYFGNELKKDLNGDGKEDVVFLLTQETGGSGTFFYVVAALQGPKGYRGSHAFFLGDRIAPQTINTGTGKIVVVNYAERLPGEPFSARPSVGKSIWLLLDLPTLTFGEVAQDFEGEASPSMMTLSMKTWDWVSAEDGTGKTILPKQKGKFSVTFTEDGNFSATTDCNSAGGTYHVDGGKLTFGPMMSTMMYCEGSQEREFIDLLGGASAYSFTSKGELIIKLSTAGGIMMFR